MNSSANEDADIPEVISLTGIIKDNLISILLLVGAVVIDWLKTKYSEHIPLTIHIIIFVIELTLLIYFVGMLLKAIAWVIRVFDSLIEVTKRSQMGTLAKPLMVISTKLAKAFFTISKIVLTILVKAIPLVVLLLVLFIWLVDTTAHFVPPPDGDSFSYIFQDIVLQINFLLIFLTLFIIWFSLMFIIYLSRFTIRKVSS